MSCRRPKVWGHCVEGVRVTERTGRCLEGILPGGSEGLRKVQDVGIVQTVRGRTSSPEGKYLEGKTQLHVGKGWEGGGGVVADARGGS